MIKNKKSQRNKKKYTLNKNNICIICIIYYDITYRFQLYI